MMSMKTDGTKGYLTATYTHLGRHYYVFRSLESELKYEKPSSLSCLIIGPGMAEQRKRKDERTNTYQPFELANILNKTNVKDYTIDILDINPEVLDELKKRPSLIRVPIIPKNQDIVIQRYYESFFPKNTIETYTDHRIVKIPESVTSRFHLQLGDIIKDELPKEKYDIVVSTVILTHYYREVTDADKDPGQNTLKKNRRLSKTKRILD